MRELSFEDRLLVRELASECRKARRAAGKTQRQLAGNLSTARTFLSKIESGKTIPRPQTLHRIAVAVDLPGGWKLLQMAEARLNRRRSEPGVVADRRGVARRDVPGLPGPSISLPDKASFAVAFGATLKAARGARGMSQGGLARRTGMPRSRISVLEHGHHHCPGILNILRLADGLNTPAWNLMRCAENRLTQPQPQTPAA